MEIKKSRKADLERGRTRRFLLGLLLSAVGFLAVLHLPLPSGDVFDDDEELLEQFTLDQELSPLMRPESQLALAPKAELQPQQHLVVAQTDESEPLKDYESVETDMDGDMEAMDDEEDEPEPPAPAADDGLPAFRVVEDLPQFPGGPLELTKWLQRNLKYPSSVQGQKVQGKVVAEFIVNVDGSVTDVRVVKSLHPLCDREVLRVLRSMPRWTAGIQNDQPCRTKVCIPVVFKL